MAKPRRRAMAVKRRGPWARVLLAVLVFLGCLAGWGGWTGIRAFLASDFMTLSTLEITGCCVLPEESVREALEPLLGRPLHRVRPDSVAAALDSLPRVRRARVRRQLPGTLVCRIEEAEGVALVWDGAWRELDADGRPLARFGDVPPDLPIIRRGGSVPADSARGLALRALAALGAASFDLAGEVSELAVEAEGLVYYRNRSATRVILGWEDYEARTRCYREVFAELTAAGAFPAELDLRFRDQVVAR